jgi:hypothetical protein
MISMDNNSNQLFISNNGVGIGETTPTARLHVKGSGNDNTTTSLLVQNSDGTDMLEVDDSGNVGIGSPNPLSATLHISSQSYFNNTTALRIQNSIGNNLFRVRGDGTTDIVNNKYIFNQSGVSTGGAIFKGSGTTSATTSLLVQNSAGTSILSVRDDGYTNIGVGQNIAIANYNDIFIKAGGTYFRDMSNNYHAAITENGAQFGLGYTGPDAGVRLQVKGSGNDATTTALLVQNSDGAELLKVLDTGDITIDDRLGIGIDYVRDLNRIQTAALSIGSNTFYAASGTQVHIKGSGTTSATTALLVQNSAGTDHLSVRDDGVTTITSSAQSVPLYINASGNATAGIEIRSTGARRFRILSTSTITTLEATNTGGISTNASLNVGSGYTPANASAVLQADSTTQGFLPPRMTTTERDAISTPAAGLMVYNTTTNKAQCYNGSTWNDLF